MAYTTIDKPSDYFETLTWSGNSTDDRAISGLDFAPNWVWIKCRNNGQNHNIFDTVRGATESLESNNGNAENTDATSLKSFTSDGYTLGTGSTVNSSSPSTKTYVGWNWLANGTGVANTDGSITSTVSANTTSGFSIVQYTGNGTSPSTVGHGLGTTPSMIILKALDSANGWKVYHKSLSTNNILFLHTTDAQATDANYHHSPNNSTFTITGGSSINVNGNRYIAYCFAEKQGFSKMKSYTGNGSADGNFTYLGFRPAFIMVKRTDNARDWVIFDNKRNSFNVMDKLLYPNTSGTEGVANTFDFLSNGFKNRSSAANVNASGGNYIYMAFAESPFTTSTGVPATAR